MPTQKTPNYDILDKILQESKQGRNNVVWIQDPRHPDGGYFVQEGNQEAGAGTNQTIADIERYLRS